MGCKWKSLLQSRSTGLLAKWEFAHTIQSVASRGLSLPCRAKMGYAFEIGALAIIYIMSDMEMYRAISSFIQEKRVFIVCMVQSLVSKIYTIKLGRFLV